MDDIEHKNYYREEDTTQEHNVTAETQEPTPQRDADQSRLQEVTKKRAYKTIILSSIGIVAVLILLAFIGIPLLIKYSLLLEKNKVGNVANTTSNTTASYIAPPVLDPTLNATSSATVTISGSTVQQHASVKLFVNDAQVDSTTAGNDNTFTFRDVKLDQGQNEIKAKVTTSDNKTSDYSQSMSISYSTKAPTLDISSPSDGQTVSEDHITVTGKTDSGDNVVTVNNYRAIVDSSGSFNYYMKLQNGDTQLQIQSSDPAGNTTTKSLKVTKTP